MPHWHESHDLRALRNKIDKAKKTESPSARKKLLEDALTLVDELLTRRGATRRFSRKNVAGAIKTIMSAVEEKPEHYTSRRLVSEFKERCGGRENVLAAIDDLKEKGSIITKRMGGGKGKKGHYVLRPLSRKAA